MQSYLFSNICNILSLTSKSEVKKKKDKKATAIDLLKSLTYFLISQQY